MCTLDIILFAGVAESSEVRVANGLAKLRGLLKEVLRSGLAQLREAYAEVPLQVKKALSPLNSANIGFSSAKLALFRVEGTYFFGAEFECRNISLVLAQNLAEEFIIAEFVRLGVAELAKARLSKDCRWELVFVFTDNAYTDRVRVRAIAEEFLVSSANSFAKGLSIIEHWVLDRWLTELRVRGTDLPVGVKEAITPAENALVELRCAELTLLRVQFARIFE